MASILYPLTTEKAAAGIERLNSITFVVDEKSTKQAIKQEAEKSFGELVAHVTTQVTPNGRKKAVVRFKRDNAAAEVAAKLKLV